MPHIKKPFEKDGAVCYKCGRVIERGTYNWSYNTHLRGAFSHSDCSMRVEVKTNPPIEVKPPAPRIEEISLPVSPIIDITEKIRFGGKHKATAWIRTILRNRKYPFLYGSPGAGKTHLALSIAADMRLRSLLVTCAQDMLKSELLGTKSPLSGAYSPSKFRDIWQHGGVVLFDECGLAPGSFLNLLNSAMEQKIIDFPDGEQIPMHPNFFMVFADNSTLYGNDPLFPERGDVGGAFRDRLTYVKFEYDEAIEVAVLTSKFGSLSQAVDWHKKVLCLRRELKKLAVPIFASPRFAYASAIWIKEGVSMDLIIEAELLRGVSEDIAAIARPVISRCLGVSF